MGVGDFEEGAVDVCGGALRDQRAEDMVMLGLEAAGQVAHHRGGEDRAFLRQHGALT